jgi:hypothetical protein
MTDLEIVETVERCSFANYKLKVGFEDYTAIWATYLEADTNTGFVETQTTRAWVIDRTTCTPSSIVATCFKCILTSMEHRAREWFLYRGEPVFHPHRNVEDLVGLCRVEKKIKKEETQYETSST